MFTREYEVGRRLHFLDVQIHVNNNKTITSTYRKPTFTGLYANWNNFMPVKYKRSLINCLVNRALRICSEPDVLDIDLMFIRNTFLNNGYPKNFVDACIKSSVLKFNEDKLPLFGPEKKKIYMVLPYTGHISAVKLQRQFSKMIGHLSACLQVVLVLKPSFKLSRLSKLKDKLSVTERSNVIYRFSCKDCNAFYIGMTTRRLHQRAMEHAHSDSSALCCHSVTTGHDIDYIDPDVLCSDTSKYRLCIKESLLIREYSAHLSLNGNLGSHNLLLW